MKEKIKVCSCRTVPERYLGMAQGQLREVLRERITTCSPQSHWTFWIHLGVTVASNSIYNLAHVFVFVCASQVDDNLKGW